MVVLLAVRGGGRRPLDRRADDPGRRLRHRCDPLASRGAPASGPAALRPGRRLALAAADPPPQRGNGTGADRRRRGPRPAALLEDGGRRATARLHRTGTVGQLQRRHRVLQLESRLRTARLAAEGTAAADRPQPRAPLLADGRARPLRRVPLARASRHAATVAGAALAFRERFRRLPRLPVGSHRPLPDRPAEQPARRRRRHAHSRCRAWARPTSRTAASCRADGDGISSGDTYSVHYYSPQPTPTQMRRASSLSYQAGAAPVHDPRRAAVHPPGGRGPERRPGAGRGADHPAHGALAIVSRRRRQPAAVDRRLLRSPYGSVYRLARRLTAGTADTYDAVEAIHRQLLGAYSYDERSTGPPLPAARLPVPRSKGLLPAVLRGDGADVEDARHTQQGRIGVQSRHSERSAKPLHGPRLRRAFLGRGLFRADRLGRLRSHPRRLPGGLHLGPAVAAGPPHPAPGRRRSAPEARTPPAPPSCARVGAARTCRRWPGSPEWARC